MRSISCLTWLVCAMVGIAFWIAALTMAIPALLTIAVIDRITRGKTCSTK